MLILSIWISLHIYPKSFKQDRKCVYAFRSADEETFEDRIVQEIDSRRIGNIVRINDATSYDITSFNVDTTVNEVSPNTVSLSVNSDTPDGKTVVIRISKALFTDMNIRILVDGKEIPQAAGYDDLFKNDKLSYLLVVGQNVEALVSVPQFSEHSILVTSAAPAVVVDTATAVPSPAKTPGFTFGIVFVVMTLLYFMFRKK